MLALAPAAGPAAVSAVAPITRRGKLRATNVGATALGTLPWTATLRRHRNGEFRLRVMRANYRGVARAVDQAAPAPRLRGLGRRSASGPRCRRPVRVHDDAGPGVIRLARRRPLHGVDDIEPAGQLVAGDRFPA